MKPSGRRLRVAAVAAVALLPSFCTAASARLRHPAIALGIAALSGLALQHMFLLNGIFHCDAP